MLAPDNRALLLDALRPPPGHSLDRAVATTFTLDLESALIVPLAFAGFQFEEQPDPIRVMEALRNMSKRFDVFCQAGAINAQGWPSDLVALLENVVHEVRRPRPGHIFHPKVWALRFLDDSQEPTFRLLVLSRNLTADRSWDTILWFDGRLEGRRKASNTPLVRFIAALPDLAVTQLTASRRAAINGLTEDLRRVRWDLPNGVREACFHPIGLRLRGLRRFQAENHFSGYRKLAISPFVRDGVLRSLLRTEKNGNTVLVSRGEELATLQPDSLNRMDTYELDPAASLYSSEDIEEETSQTLLTHLHAKVFVVERARRAHLYIGSANATDAGLNSGNGNIEFLCELIGPVKRLGVDALVGEDTPFRTMLTPYVASETPDSDEARKVERVLEDLLIDIAGDVQFRTSVTKRGEKWASRITTELALPCFPESMSLTIAAHNRPAEIHPLSPGESINVEMQPRELADVTPFLQLTARLTVEGNAVERSAVICSLLDGAPEERFNEIMARQIDTPEKFLRLLALLIGFASGGSGFISAAGDGSATWSAGPCQGTLELLARALSENPESIDYLESIVEYLRQDILPPGWDNVWLPALEARHAMLKEDV
ncbi:MAG: hypothetical protein F4Y49_11205 [Dehalococcoidia bacterium]|nr:hypothetical protein [Dehalococcoidia bacterium]